MFEFTLGAVSFHINIAADTTRNSRTYHIYLQRFLCSETISPEFQF